jgi:RNA polymerase Rpb1, domain 5.
VPSLHACRSTLEDPLKLGQLVNQGDPLVDGPLDLQEVLDYKGIDALQNYIVKELNAIFMANGINVNEKHIEIIIRQMCQKVQILDPGDSDYTVGELINYNLALTRNAELLSKNQKPILFKRVVTGISKAALSTDSWLAAASFQETSRVLVDAVISGRKDYLVGLKGYRARIRNHGHSCFLCEIVIRSQFHTTYEPEA